MRDKLERTKDRLRNVESKLSEYRMRCKLLEMTRSQKHQKLSASSDEDSSEGSYVLLTPKRKRRKNQKESAEETVGMEDNI